MLYFLGLMMTYTAEQKSILLESLDILYKTVLARLDEQAKKPEKWNDSDESRRLVMLNKRDAIYSLIEKIKTQ